MSNHQNYILWLPSWYPNELEPYNGDFVKRHAEALSLHKDVYVLHVVRDSMAVVTKDLEVKFSQTGRLRETIIYFHTPPTTIPGLGRLISYFQRARIYKREIRRLFASEGTPMLVHAYITLRSDGIPMWIRKHFGVPYVIGEQSTQFLHEDKPGFLALPPLRRALIHRLFKQAAGIMVVSEYLGRALKERFERGYTVIPNVVNTDVFHSGSPRQFSGKSFLHISTLGYQKNAVDILKAFSLLSPKVEARLSIVGNLTNEIKELISELGIQNTVVTYGEMPQADLAALMVRSDALILYSRYETFGCVIIEANAAGLPVIVSDIPVFHENVSDGVNGYFVIPENPEALAKLLEGFTPPAPDEKRAIARWASDRYSYQRIGKMIADWYEDVLNRKK